MIIRYVSKYMLKQKSKVNKKKLSNTLLFGGSGFLGPNILERYPEIICVGRTKPPSYIKNKFIKLNKIENIKKLDQIKFDKVIFLIGNSDHHKLNSSELDLALSYNFYPLYSKLLLLVFLFSYERLLHLLVWML